VRSGRYWGRRAATAVLLVALSIAATAGVREGARSRERVRQQTSRIRSEALSAYLAERGDSRVPDVLVVIPAYNEEDSLRDVLIDVPTKVGGMAVEALVVIDGATDSTEVVTRSFLTPVVHAMNRGQTAALVTGYEVAKVIGASVVVTLDADGQMVPAEIHKLVGPVVRGEADLVTGFRTHTGEVVDSVIRTIGIRLYGALASILAGQRIRDPSIGMRAISLSALSRLALVEERFGAAELLIQASKRNLRILEVPVTIRSRSGGESRKPPAFSYGLGFGLAMLRSAARR